MKNMTPVRIRSIQSFSTRPVRINEAPALSGFVNLNRGEWVLTEGRYLVHLDSDRIDLAMAASLSLSGATVSTITRDKAGKPVVTMSVYTPIVIPEDYVAAYDTRRTEDGERRRPGRPKRVKVEE